MNGRFRFCLIFVYNHFFLFLPRYSSKQQFSNENHAAGYHQSKEQVYNSNKLQKKNENAFSYFPNPVKNELSLKAQSNIENVSVFNMLGDPSQN